MLHIISNPNAISDCTAHLVNDDAVILIGDGVYGLKDPSLASQVPVFALESDLVARGILATSNVTPTKMSQFVALVVEHASSVTWT